MISRKRLNLFPVVFELKKFGLTWKRIGNCCNLDYFVLKQILLFKFAFTDKVYWRCQQCGKLHCIELQYHFTPYYDSRIREENRSLDNGQIQNMGRFS